MSETGQEKHTKKDASRDELESLRLANKSLEQLLRNEQLLRKSQETALIKANRELADKVAKLEKAGEEARTSRRAALNLMEDAIASKEALRVNEERMRRQKEAFQAAVRGAPLHESLDIIASLVNEETGGDARTAFYLADKEGKRLHPVFGAGNMSEDYLKEIDGFLIGKDSLACGLAVPTGRPVLTADVLEDPLWKPWTFIAEKYHYRGCWSFPIKTYEDKAVGTFAMYFREPREAKPVDLILADIVTQTAAVIISGYLDTQKRIYVEKELRESEEKYRIKLEQDVSVRTAELSASKKLLQATMDASMDMVQVFEAVRNEEEEIVDFKYLLVNHEAEKRMPNAIGKSLLELQPGVVTEGIFDAFKHVVETGISDQSERHYVHEQFDGWFYQSAVKLGDGVATTTTDISARKAAEEKLRKMEAEQQLEIFRVSLSTLEEERYRISESLHNGIGQILYGVKIALASFSHELSEEEFEHANSYVNKLLTDAIKETRRVSHELMPTTLEQFGLKSAINDICDQLANGTRFNCNVVGLHGRLAKYLELAIFRTVQELMNNVIKHAKATQASVDIKVEKKQIDIRVSDNGIGIQNCENSKPGIGLASIRSKIKLLNGDMHIDSETGQGTTVTVKIPM